MEVWLIIVNAVFFIIMLLALIYCIRLLKYLREEKDKLLAKEKADSREKTSLLPPSYEKATLSNAPFSSADEDDELLDYEKRSDDENIKTLHMINETEAERCQSEDEDDDNDDDMNALSAYGEPVSNTGTLRMESKSNLHHQGLRLVASFVYSRSNPDYLAGKITGLFDLPNREHRFDLYRVSIVFLPSKKFVLITRHCSAWISCRINEYFKFSFNSTPSPLPADAKLKIKIYGMKLEYGVPGKEILISDVFVDMKHISSHEKGIVFNRAVC